MFLKEQKQKELQKASDNYVAGGRGRKQKQAQTQDVNYTHIFTLILRLRQCSVAPYLIHTVSAGIFRQIQPNITTFDIDISLIS
jgi:hypothetical protein